MVDVIVSSTRCAIDEGCGVINPDCSGVACSWSVEITSGNGQAAAYVGRTGDTSSANAASLFARMAGHLNDKKNAKSNSLLKRLVATNFVCHECSYRVIGIGPLFDQQASMDLHKPIRDQMAALERALADHLKEKGYVVLGDHPKPGSVDPGLWIEVLGVIEYAISPPSNNELQRPGAPDACYGR
jgi:hypothetical protein